MNISTNFVMVILEAKSNPVIMELLGSLGPQQPARTSIEEGEGPLPKGPGWGDQCSNCSPATSGCDLTS